MKVSTSTKHLKAINGSKRNRGRHNLSGACVDKTNGYVVASDGVIAMYYKAEFEENDGFEDDKPVMLPNEAFEQLAVIDMQDRYAKKVSLTPHSTCLTEAGAYSVQHQVTDTKPPNFEAIKPKVDADEVMIN